MGPVRRNGDDQGFSLTEIMVSMSILSVVMVVVMGGIVHIYSAVTRTDNSSVARDQLGATFQRLDKELRYAQWVSAPGQVGGRWYLEYAIPTTASGSATGERLEGCHQLTYNNGVLTLATWALPGTTPGTATTLATGLTPMAGAPPFTVHAAGAIPYASASPGTAGVGRNFAPEHAQVRFRFNSTQGRLSLPYDVVFTAQNTSRNTSALNDCSKGRPAS